MEIRQQGSEQAGIKEVVMEEEKEKEEEAQEKEKQVEDLPFCTTAPSAEHARGSDEDEPCYDYREGR
jgi:deoxycytidylate deaminase